MRMYGGVVYGGECMGEYGGGVYGGETCMGEYV
jgi:hypothetical protein